MLLWTAAEAMRRILAEAARRRLSQKRGGDWTRRDVDDFDLVGNLPPDELLSLNDAIDALSKQDPAAAELVKVRYFAGLSVEDAAAAVGLSRASAYRHWTFARAWLFACVRGNERPASP